MTRSSVFEETVGRYAQALVGQVLLCVLATVLLLALMLPLALLSAD